MGSDAIHTTRTSRSATPEKKDSLAALQRSGSCLPSLLRQKMKMPTRLYVSIFMSVQRARTSPIGDARLEV
jgi:hypothetical protein